MNYRVREIKTGADRKRFVLVPWEIYRGDDKWVPPLIQDRLQTIDPRKNPFFEHADVALFVLEDENGRPVGRISAQVNHLHNEYHKEKTGFFGFFECIDDQKAARLLLETAEKWLAERGMNRILGPESFSTNDECGLLVEEREGPPMIMCSYNPPYYARLLESAGYQKAKDLYGWYYQVGEIPDAPRQIAEEVEKHPGLVVRQVQARHMERDIRIVRDIFNAAWCKNWGYVPWTEKEVIHAAEMMKMILAPELTAIAEVDGQPAGMMLAFPNLLEAIKDLNGRLLPTGLLKLVWRVMLRRWRFHTGRLFLLGVKPEYRGSVLGGLSVLLYVKAHVGARQLGIRNGELGWTLEDNQKINTGIQFMGGRLGKIYRIYGRDL